MLNQADIKRLADDLHGNVIQPEDRDYDEARTLYNAMIDKRPRLIVRCADRDDIRRAVEFSRRHQLDTAIRGGGHNGPGLASVDDGLVIDCSPMKEIEVDQQNQIVHVGPGCTWGDVDKATHKAGLATVSGIISTTGVGGLALGGGHGYLSRKYGLTVDNLLAASVVLADGSVVQANEEQHPDLYWALRGGGGNFGVVTRFSLQLHPVDNVIGGPLFWPVEDLEKTLLWYRDWLPNAPEDIYAFYLKAEVPSAAPFPEDIWGRKICGLVFCCTGDRKQADAVLEEARKLATPLFEHIDAMPYPTLQSLFDDLYCPGLQWYWKGDFFRELSDGAVAEHVRFAEVPTMHSTMHLYPIDGAVRQRSSDDTAWAFRDANWSMVIAGVDPDPANRDKIKHWARNHWEALHPFSLGAGYINFMMEEGDERIASTYQTNHERLRRIKRRYDPDNLFHINQNIKPAG